MARGSESPGHPPWGSGRCACRISIARWDGWGMLGGSVFPSRNGDFPMKRCGLLLLAAGLCLAADDAKDAAKAEMKKLEGTWVATSIEYDGDQVLGGEVKDVKLVIAGEEISVKGAIPDA